MSNKETFENFSNRRKQKAPIFPKIVTEDSVNALVGDYLFDNWGVAYLDLSEYDFSNVSLEIMTKLCFSSSTIWPTKDKLPNGYNPSQILKECTRTNDEVVKLHNHGINGEGITRAVIDSGFQAENHVEFKDAFLERCTLNNDNIDYHFHMEDVLSKLCGKNLGIAPRSKVLYYEIDFDEDDSKYVHDALMDILKRVENGEKIRAVSCSFSMTNYDTPFEYEKENFEIIEKLKKKGCEVISSDLFSENFFCCGTTFLDQNKYKTCTFASDMLEDERIKDNVNIVCSGKTIPEYCSNDGYKYEVVDCFSWSIPQCVGYYALCLQVNPKLTFDEFTSLARNNCNTNADGLKVFNIEKIIKNFQ